MNEAQAREVLLLQAFETYGSGTPARGAEGEGADGDSTPAAEPNWSPQDGLWASRAARDSVARQAEADAWIAERARHAMQRLAPREPAVTRALRGRLWRPVWLLAGALVGLLLGLALDKIGSGQRIDLLAPPVWGVLLWNLIVYALLLAGALRALWTRRRAVPGAWTRWMHHLFGPARTLRSDARARQASATPDIGTVMQRFGAVWSRASTPLTAARVGAVFHVMAAMLGAGLIAGMYLRGLVLDYRAGWESTFLDAGFVHAVLAKVLAPALALSDIAMPDVAAIDAMRLEPGRGAASAPAAPWIHLYALMLALLVIVPRLLLWLWSSASAWRLARRFPLALDDGYFQRLLRHRQGRAVQARVLPYAQPPSQRAREGLAALFAQAYGDAAKFSVAPEVVFGGEEEFDPGALLGGDATLALALFDMTATPEAELQGRFVQRLAAHRAEGKATPVVVMVDETAFRQRFGTQRGRVDARRQAWRELADGLGTVPVFVSLDAPDVVDAEPLLQSALGRPARETSARGDDDRAAAASEST